MLLGISLAEGRWDQVLHYACPVAAFGIGILLAYFLTQLVWRDGHGQGTCMILALEIAGLFAVPDSRSERGGRTGSKRRNKRGGSARKGIQKRNCLPRYG